MRQRFSTHCANGFTLVEVLVVIAILGILAGIVLVSSGGARSSARDARRAADIRQISTAMELYYNANDTYPQQMLIADVKEDLLPYLASFPADPQETGSCAGEYCWLDNKSTGENQTDQSYCIYAHLEERPVGGGDAQRYAVADHKGMRKIQHVGPPITIPCPE